MELRKDYFSAEREDHFEQIGHSPPRFDAHGHVTGRTTFFADRHLAGMLHLAMVRSPHHHARIRAIDTAAAERVGGVVRVLTHRDVPHNRYTILSLIGVGPEDENVLAEGKVRFAGEAVAAVLAESEAAARAGVAAVRVDYEELPAVLDVEQALAAGAPLVNEAHPGNRFDYQGHPCCKVRLGDVERGFAEAALVLEDVYQSSPIEQAPSETTGCIVAPAENDRFVCYTNTQGLFFALDNAAVIVEQPSHRLHFVGGTVGGGFGGKVDVIVEPVTVLACMLTRRPVRYAYTRPEEMQVSSVRGAERIHLKHGMSAGGRLLACKITAYTDSGAYSRLSPYGAIKAAGHFPGPYTIPNVWIDSYCVYTNRTPSSAMRGFGVTIGDFAVEVQMDRLAEMAGMDPLEFRVLNAYRDGDPKAHHQPTCGAALIECIQAAAQASGWPLAGRALSASSLGGDRR